MPKLTLEFSDAPFSRPSIRNKYDLLLGVEATLFMKISGRLVYTEPMFPIVELRDALGTWLPAGEGDFEFASMESDEVGLSGCDASFQAVGEPGPSIRTTWRSKSYPTPTSGPVARTSYQPSTLGSAITWTLR